MRHGRDGCRGLVAVLTVLAASCGGGSGSSGPSTTNGGPPATAVGATTTEGTGTTVVAAATTTRSPSDCPEVSGPGDAASGAAGPAGVMVVDSSTGEFAWEVEVGGTVTVATAVDVVVAGDDTAVRAFDATDGSLRWCQAGAAAVVAAGDRIVVAAPGKPIRAVEAATGDEAWTSGVASPNTPGTPGGVGGMGLSAGTHNVYVDSSMVQPPGIITAIDALTGETRWTWEPSGCATSSGPAMVCIGGPWSVVEAELAYILDVNAGRLVALDPRTGSERWTAPIAGQPGSLAADDDVVLLTSIDPFATGPDGAPLAPVGSLTAFDPTTGETRWSRPFSGVAAVAQAGHVVLLEQSPTMTEPPVGPPPDIATRVTALDPATGAERWTQTLPGELPLTVTAVADLLVLDAYPPTGAPGFRALNVASGATRWQTTHAMPFLTDQFNSYSGYEAPQPAAGGRRFAAVIRAFGQTD